jgi:hypothetical protein
MEISKDQTKRTTYALRLREEDSCNFEPCFPSDERMHVIHRMKAHLDLTKGSENLVDLHTLWKMKSTTGTRGILKAHRGTGDQFDERRVVSFKRRALIGAAEELA